MTEYSNLVSSAYYAAMSYHRGNNQPIPTRMYRANLANLSDDKLQIIIDSYKKACGVISTATTKTGTF